MLQGLTGFDLRAHVHLQREQQALRSEASYRVDRNGIVVLQITGTMTKRGSSLSGGGTVRLRRQLREAASDPEVRGILLAIESPGGTVAGTKELADDVADINANSKPVHAFIEDLGASAAYYVASQADRVTANLPAMVGSIGTFMVVYDVSSRMGQMGVKAHVIRAGKFKGAGAFGSEVTEAQIEEWQSLITDSNELFLNAVATGRDMSLAQVRQVADGRVHLASHAMDLKLIDGVGTISEAISALSAVANPRKREVTMSENKTEPTAATIEQLRAACPGASSDFLLKQLEANATVQSAQTAFIVEQNEQVRKANAEVEEAKASAAKAEKEAEEAKSKQQQQLPGNDVHQDNGGGSNGDAATGGWRGENARAAWTQKIAELTDRGVDRIEATSIVDRDNPGLREAMNEAYVPPEHAQSSR